MGADMQLLQACAIFRGRRQRGNICLWLLMYDVCLFLTVQSTFRLLSTRAVVKWGKYDITNRDSTLKPQRAAKLTFNTPVQIERNKTYTAMKKNLIFTTNHAILSTSNQALLNW
jgi:hypothetical protein